MVDILYIAGGLLLAHVGVIVEFSMISGRYRRHGIFVDRSIILNHLHIFGLVCLVISGLFIYFAFTNASYLSYIIISGIFLIGDFALACLAIVRRFDR